MYLVIWKDGMAFSFKTDSWISAFEMYDKLYKSGIEEIVIRDTALNREFEDYYWK